MVALAPEKHPDPGPIDLEYLLNELARLRERVFQAPPHNDTIASTNTVLQSIQRLEQQLQKLCDQRRPDSNR